MERSRRTPCRTSADAKNLPLSELVDNWRKLKRGAVFFRERGKKKEEDVENENEYEQVTRDLPEWIGCLPERSRRTPGRTNADAKNLPLSELVRHLAEDQEGCGFF